MSAVGTCLFGITCFTSALALEGRFTPMQVAQPMHMPSYLADATQHPPVPAGKDNLYELLRPDFGSPEAVQSFLLQAYRPFILPAEGGESLLIFPPMRYGIQACQDNIHNITHLSYQCLCHQ